MTGMNKYIFGIYAGLALLFSACTQQENMENMDDSHKITIHFDVPDTGTARSAETIKTVEDREVLLNVIDVFIFAGSETTPSDDAQVTYHERASGAGIDYTLKADKRNYTGTYVVYVLANVPEKDAVSLSAVKTYKEFKDLKLESGICNPYADNASYFLMDGKSAPISISTANQIDVTLKRAAANVEVVLSLPTDWDTTSENEQFTWAEGGVSSGYWVNPPMTVFLSAEKDIQGQDIRYGSNIENDNINAIDHGYQTNKKRFVLYSYPAIWQGGDFDHETYLILNLPITIGGNAQTYNYYKVRINRNTSGTLNIERNKHYKINITVGTKGSTTPEEAVELPGSVGVFDWIPHDINIGNGDDTKFLVLSEESIEFYNSEENQIVEYASSSPIKSVYIKGIGDSNQNDAPYYYDQFGKKQFVDNDDYSTKANVTLDGHIAIESKLLENAAPKYYTVVVTNEEGITKEFDVVQYPLEYITSMQGIESYREDLKKNGEIITKDNFQRLRVTENETRNMVGSSRNYYMFANKYVDGINNDGTSTVRYNYYVERNSIQYSTNRNQNARIYHITITRTSNDYVLAVPDMDQNNFTSDDKDNQQKVSPSFMIASRLGLINNMGNKKVDYEWAQKHCEQYVEVATNAEGQKVTYADWRLPTPKELEIIVKFQTSDHNAVIDNLLNENDYYWGAGAAVKYEKNKITWSTDTDADWIRCVRDAYRNTEPQN